MVIIILAMHGIRTVLAIASTFMFVRILLLVVLLVVVLLASMHSSNTHVYYTTLVKLCKVTEQ